MFNASGSYLEPLSNELLLEIVEYLDVYELFTAFYGLNHRFNDLIRQCYLHVRFDPSRKSIETRNLITSTIDSSHFLIFLLFFFNLHRIAIEEFYWREDIIEFLQNNILNLQSLYIHTYSSILYQQSLSKYVLKNVFKLDMNINIHSINIKCLGHMFPSLQRLSIQWDTFRQYPSIDGFQW
ncbi:unnamed protein product [Rotaria sordida]|uniref:F-box domain-containing protein n=1 Tax=Rotaria sordida TaxID=392033 RepID=A0A814B4V4_9BILA|nr:unnamed protein product [Rotaria sordida]CAF1228704.1 unnamed protein product [Rotaria sordida]